MNDTGSNREVIGDFVELRFANLPSSQFIRGKVDTGATICSLHCSDYKMNEGSGQITFNCPDISQNSITMPLADKQAVKSADNGTEYRPVVEMSVKIGEQVLEKIKFNLNDRAGMDSPVLIGQNLIKAGGFLIDPSQRVSENIETLDGARVVSDDHESDEEHANNVVHDAESQDDGTQELDDVDVEADAAENPLELDIEVVYQLMRRSKISFADIIQYAESHGTVATPQEPSDDEFGPVDDAELGDAEEL